MDYRALLHGSSVLDIVRRDKAAGTLSHAYAVFADDADCCKEITYLIAEAIVCPDAGCGKCIACTMLQDGCNGDVRIYDEALGAAAADKIVEDALMYSVSGGNKIYVINNAETMNAAAQNKLLKTIEEPEDNVIFVLGITKPAAVAETLKSRCKKLYFEGADTDLLLEQLIEEYGDTDGVRRAAAFCDGNVGRARAMAGDAAFAADTDMLIALLGDMQKSSQVCQEEKSLKKDKDSMLGYIDILEIILRLMSQYKRGDKSCGQGGIAALSAKFTDAALAATEYLLNDCRRRLESNCSPVSVADTLLFGILEVQYKCR